jgi:hypothetical protein
MRVLMRFNLVLDQSLIGSVGGGESFVLLEDNLCLGPSRLDPDQHIKSRREVNTAPELVETWSAYARVFTALQSCSELVIWGATTWSNRLMVAMVASKLPSEVVCVFKEVCTVDPFDGLRCGAPRFGETPSLQVIEEELRSELRAIWHDFTSTSPASVLGAAAAAWIPAGTVLRDMLSALFPRRRSGLPFLSAHDESLLRSAALGLSAADLLSCEDDELMPAWQWAHCGGDVFTAARLAELAGCGALEVSRPTRSLITSKYELTSLGRELLAGVERPPALSGVAVGGAIAYYS